MTFTRAVELHPNALFPLSEPPTTKVDTTPLVQTEPKRNRNGERVMSASKWLESHGHFPSSI